MSQPVVFISYSHKDEAEKEQLLSHLGVLQETGLVKLWSVEQIGAGSNWKNEIAQSIAQAKVAVLLISANFLTSESILSQEIPALLERYKNEGLIVFPIIAKACPWRTVDWLAEMEVRPAGGKPIWSGGGSHADEDLAAIAEEIALIVDESKIGPVTSTSPVMSLNELSDQLFGILLTIPALQSQDSRGLLLRNLPAGPVTTINRSGAPMADLSSIVNIVTSWGRLENGEWALAVIAKNALLLVQGTEPGDKLESWLLELNKLSP